MSNDDEIKTLEEENEQLESELESLQTEIDSLKEQQSYVQLGKINWESISPNPNVTIGHKGTTYGSFGTFPISGNP